MSDEQIARRLRAGLDTPAPTIDVDPRAVVRRGRRRRTARTALVSAAAGAMVAGMALSTLLAARPPASTPATSAPPTPSPTHRADGTVVQTVAGDLIQLDSTWSVYLHQPSGVELTSPKGDIMLDISEATTSPVDDPAATRCVTAVACADAAQADGGTTTEQTVGNVTYYKVEPDSAPPAGPDYVQTRWYVDWDGHTYEIFKFFGSTAVVDDLVTSIDWTGRAGTTFGLPPGARIGLDLPRGWTTRNFLSLSPVGSTATLGYTGDPSTSWDGVLGSYDASCSSAAACAARDAADTATQATQIPRNNTEQNFPIPDDTTPTERKVNGVTYDVITFSSSTDGTTVTPSETASWYCERNGHVYRFDGSTTAVETFATMATWVS